MTSFYVEVDRWGGWRDKKAEAKVVGLAASSALLFATAQQPQGPFVDVLSAECHSVKQFFSIMNHHHSRHQQGIPNHHQPEDYKVHWVSILKRYVWIQDETLVFEICHNLPVGIPHPQFDICVDRSADHSDKSLAFDRITCSPMIPVPPRSTTLWSLRISVNNMNQNPFNLLRLAALLCATIGLPRITHYLGTTVSGTQARRSAQFGSTSWLANRDLQWLSRKMHGGKDAVFGATDALVVGWGYQRMPK